QVRPSAQQFLHDRVRACTVRALVVAVLDEGDRRVLGTENMISIVDRYGEPATGCCERRSQVVTCFMAMMLTASQPSGSPGREQVTRPGWLMSPAVGWEST